MALIECFECKKQISGLAPACPGCGAPTSRTQPTAMPPEPEKKSGSIWKWLFIVPAGLLLFFLVVGALMPDDPARDERWLDETGIKICWENQAKKSNAPDAARFIAGACEKMEADFRKKHGRNP